MGKAKTKVNWSEGDIFAIPLQNGQFLLGQELAKETSIGAGGVAIFDARLDKLCEPPALTLDAVIAILFTTRDQIERGNWPIVARRGVVVPKDRFPYESTRASGFVGAKIVGSGNVVEFANAFCALAPWDKWADPAYLDKMLVTPDKKPSDLIYSKQS